MTPKKALVALVIAALSLVATPSHATPKHSGSLRVTLAGLPDTSAMTARPSITITSGQTSRVIHRTRRLSHLRPGTYTLTPDPVYLRDGRKLVAQSQTVKVRNRTHIRLTYTTAQQPTGAAVWNILLIVVRNTDTDYTDASGARRHLTARLPDDDVAELRTAMTTSIPQAVRTWSNGEVAWNVEIQESEVPITQMSAPGDGSQWVAPQDVSTAISQFYRPGYHDQVLVYWRGSDDNGNSIPTPGWGLSHLQRHPDYGYASVSYAHPGTWNPTSADMPTQVWIHEWLHSASAFFAALGYDIPTGDADGAWTAGFQPEQSPYPGWGTYYAALMTAQVPHDGALIGIPAGAWQRGSIRNWGSASVGTLGGLSMDEACAQQHGAGTTAHFRDFSDPYSWYCASPSASLGGVDLNRACVARYGPGATAALGEGTAYGWYCRR